MELDTRKLASFMNSVPHDRRPGRTIVHLSTACSLPASDEQAAGADGPLARNSAALSLIWLKNEGRNGITEKRRRSFIIQN